MRLQFNSAAVGVDRQVDETLLVVDAGQVAVDDRVVWAKAQSS